MKYIYAVIASLIVQFAFGGTVAESFIYQNSTNTEGRAFSVIDSLNEQAFQVKRKDVNKAFSLLSDAINLSSKYRYGRGEATAYLYEAGIYQQNGYSKKALSLYYKSLELSRRSKDTFNIARAKQQIASALIEASKLSEAETLYYEALQDYSSLNHKEDVINMYNSLGLLKIKQGDIEVAKNYLSKASTLSEEIGYKYGLKKANFHLGLLYSITEEFSKAKAYLNHAIAIDTAIDDKYGLSLSYNKLATIYFKQGDHKKALLYAQQALQKASDIYAIQLEIEAIENIISLYQNQHRYKEVIEWQSALIQRHTKLSDREKTYAVNFLDILKDKQHEQLAFEKQAIQAEQRAKLTNYVLLLVTLVLGIIAIVAPVWYKNYLKIKEYSSELAAKNKVIENNALSLQELNQAVSLQNESLEETNKMKDKLLSIISHDLRNPLMNTKGLLQIINSGIVKEADYKVMFEKLEKQYTVSISLLDNMLFWLKGQMSGEKVDLKSLKVHRILQGIMEEQELASKAKNISIINEAHPNLEVMGDSEMLKVIFRNLLSNSVKFTKTNGCIFINSTTAQAAYITIKDEGIGMSEQVMEKIKGKQYFTSKGTNNEIGTGFGLMICADLIQKMGGEFTITSELNKGTEFTLKLPLASPSVEKKHKQVELQLS